MTHENQEAYDILYLDMYMNSKVLLTKNFENMEVTRVIGRSI